MAGYGAMDGRLGNSVALEQLRRATILVTNRIIRGVCLALKNDTPLSLSSDDEMYLIDAKEDLLKALLKLNLALKLRILADICEHAESPLGKIFWTQRELTAPSLEKGTLYQVSKELEKYKLIHSAREAAFNPDVVWHLSKAQIKILVHAKEDLLAVLLELEPSVKQRVLLQALDKQTVLGGIFWTQRKLTAPNLSHGTLAKIVAELKKLDPDFVTPVSSLQSRSRDRLLFKARPNLNPVDAEGVEMQTFTQ